MPISFKLRECDDALHSFAMRDFRAAYAGHEQQLRQRRGRDSRVPSGEHVVQHTHFRDTFTMYKRAGAPEPGNDMRRFAVVSGPRKANRAVPAIDAADAIE